VYVKFETKIQKYINCGEKDKVPYNDPDLYGEKIRSSIFIFCVSHILSSFVFVKICIEYEQCNMYVGDLPHFF
jgi:hypothetical protein